MPQSYLHSKHLNQNSERNLPYKLVSYFLSRSEFFIQSESQSAESLSDVAAKTRAGGCKSRSGVRVYIYNNVETVLG